MDGTYKMRKNIIAAILASAMILYTGVISTAQNETKNIVITATEDEVYFGNEWEIIALAQSGQQISEEIRTKYCESLLKELKENNGMLHERKYTEYSRTILALTAMGIDPSNFYGYCLVDRLNEYDNVVWQGTNGAIFALIALDCHDYLSDVDIRNKYIDYILSMQNDDGGISLSKNSKSDLDITAMAVQALSRYLSDTKVNECVEKSINYLSNSQLPSGGFALDGIENCESTSQVIIAMTSLGIDNNDVRFVKNDSTAIDALLNYKMQNGFKHNISDSDISYMATQQARCAGISYDNLKQGKEYIYDLRGKELTILMEFEPENISINNNFIDISEYKYKDEISKLYSMNIISGMSDEEFMPNRTMTRAEFTKVVTGALGLSAKEVCRFTDVSEDDWFYSFVVAAYENEIVFGVSDSEFAPNNTITRQEACVMVMRASEKLGFDINYDDTRIINAISEFDDYTQCASWSLKAVAFCVENNMISSDTMNINPNEDITRGEICKMIYEMVNH